MRGYHGHDGRGQDLVYKEKGLMAGNVRARWTGGRCWGRFHREKILWKKKRSGN